MGGRPWPLMLYPRVPAPSRLLRERRAWPIGRWLLIGAVLGWFAL